MDRPFCNLSWNAGGNTQCHCALAANIGQLIAFRILQAVGGSMLVANSTIIVTDAFRRSELGKAMGILCMIMAAAFVVGTLSDKYGSRIISTIGLVIMDVHQQFRFGTIPAPEHKCHYVIGSS